MEFLCGVWWFDGFCGFVHLFILDILEDVVEQALRLRFAVFGRLVGLKTSSRPTAPPSRRDTVTKCR